MMRQGFLNIIVLAVVAAVAAGIGGYLLISQKITPLKEVQKNDAGEANSKQTDVEAEDIAETAEYKKREDNAVNKTIQPVDPRKNQPPQIKSAQNIHPVQTSPPQNQPAVNLNQQFVAIENELMESKKKGYNLAPEHSERISRDLDDLGRRGYSGVEIERLRKMIFELSPHLQDQEKQNQTAPSAYVSAAQAKCQSNSAPVFANDITDMSKVNYIAPPPTMGAGPSLKPHSYIGTDHARVPVYAPIDMTLITGAHTVGGPDGFIFRVSCEVQMRFGHITEQIQEIKDVFPSTPAQDSRDQKIDYEIFFKAGEVIAYTTGTEMAGNWDFGVYNSVTSNRYASDPQWNISATYTTAVCPFDYFPANLKSVYFSKFNSAILGGNPPHGESFCR